MSHKIKPRWRYAVGVLLFSASLRIAETAETAETAEKVTSQVYRGEGVMGINCWAVVMVYSSGRTAARSVSIRMVSTSSA